MRTATPTDDRQLWRIVDIVEGHECIWPLYCTPSIAGGESCVLAELAMPVETEAQWRFVSERLNPISYYSDGPRWLIRPTILEKHAHKCSGVTPAYYLKWWKSEPGSNLEISGNIRQHTASDNSHDTVSRAEDFIRFCCAEAAFTNIPQARLLFSIFCRNAMVWLLEKNKPLPMGFCTLYALPYRVNWKAMLHKQWPEILKTFRGKKSIRREVLEASGFMASLHSSNLIEMHDESAFGWTIEVVEEKPFVGQVQQMEAEIIANSDKPFKYVNRWGRILCKHYDDIIDIFGAYLEKASKPLGSVDTTLPRDSWRLSTRKTGRAIHASRAPVPEAPATTQPHNPLCDPPGESGTDEAKAESV